ncbi:hypothetical protein F3J23_10755 [Chryseobacterium sp. Tr-659]|uniref:hypothetical protein n=1 Tax=Chryseobacterium sp. Tr-659 TaxID=2608340 RepID=UPI00141D8218|nr:hypothetical protein [Chryseobacterium sp. Tr-659]NIF05921.1 hypothetical protein [Chryseobacterium sp. Tr-659]
MYKISKTIRHKSADNASQSTTYIPLGGTSAADQDLFAQEQEYYMHSVDINNNTLILTTLDNFQVGGSSDFSDDSDAPQTTIIAELLTLTGALKAQNLTIAGIITSSDNGTFDVSGNPPVAQPPAITGNGGPASPGNPAGTIQLLSQQVNIPLPQFNAAGGDGQNGQNASEGIGGDSGNGGNGGNVTCQIFSPFLASVNNINTVLSNLNKAALYDLSDQLQTAFPNSALDSKFQEIKTKADALFPSDQPVNPSVLGALTSLLDELSADFTVEDKSLQSGIISQINNHAGNAGKKGDGSTGDGSVGKYGTAPKAGDINVTTFDTSPTPGSMSIDQGDSGTSVDQAFLTQTKMALQKAKMAYLQADSVEDPDAMTTAAILLQRLTKRLDFVLNQQGTLPTNLLPYQSIYNEANAYMRQFAKGMDYYGHGYNYVPLVALKQYQTVLQTLVNNLQEIENAYASYFSSLQNQDQTRANVQIVKSAAGTAVKTAQANIDDLYNLMDTTGQNIGQYEVPIATKEAYLEATIKQTSLDIMAYYNAPDGFEIFDDVVSALSTFAMAPSGFMGFLQGADTIAKTINSFSKAAATIPDDQGSQINRTYLVSQVTSLGDDINNLNESYTQLDDGSLSPSDPGASKILATESQLMQLLNSFKNELPDDIKAVQDAFTDYIQCINNRNNLILQYNAMLDLVVQYNSQIDSANQTISQANQVSKNQLDPALPSVVNAVGNMFNIMRDQVLSCAYEASRALQFWSLSNTNFFAEALGFDQGGMVPSDITFNFIESAFSQQWLTALENFSTNPTPFPANPLTQSGAIYRIDDPNILQTMKNEGAVIINIPAITKGSFLDGNWANSLLFNAANVRITNVCVWLDGAEVTPSVKNPQDDYIQLTITHQGMETLVSPENEQYKFEHQSISKTFTYSSKSLNVEIPANFGIPDSTDPTSGENFTLLGPFTNWKIEIENVSSSTEDLSTALNNGKVLPGSTVQIDNVTYNVVSVQQQNSDILLNVTLFGLPKQYTLSSNVIKDPKGKAVVSAIAILPPDPSAKQTDLSGLTAIRMELFGTLYTFS